MKKIKLSGKGFFTILFSLIVLTFFVTICERVIRSQFFYGFVNNDFLNSADSESGLAVTTDWEKIYPFKGETAQENEEAAAKKAENEKSLVSIYKSYVQDIEGKIEYYTGKLLFGRMKLVELNSLYNKFIGMKFISGSDDVVCLADGSLSFYPEEYDVTGSAENLVEFSKDLSEQGIDLLYVQAPSKVDPDNNYLPGGIQDYNNIKSDKLLDILDKNGVNYLDIRKCMKDENMNYTDAFYITDHHWKTGTGLWASNLICRNLSQVSSIPYDSTKLKPDSYTERVYEKYMFGSLGKLVTLSYAKPEDISVYTPKFPTNFTVNYYDFGLYNGTFEKTLLRMDALKKGDYYNSSAYSVYMRGVAPVVSIENHNATNDKRVLFIGDSFSHCVVPQVATQVRYLDKLDLRYFNGSVESFIEKNKPDAVVVMYYPSTLDYSKFSTMRFK